MASMIFNLFFILLSVITCIGSPVPEKKSQLDRLYSGKATWFIPDTGACGDVNSTEDYIVAMNHAQYQGGAPCHKTVSITNKATGKSVQAKVTDECPPCAYGSLDLSPSVFKALGNMDDGILPISWQFV
ncbi:hypothetical protein MJO29_009711 [Puccinia striiformis f. sp. tritici]|uniref:RlpA-like protein double-psi beta-barrel domain-containing protein n=3 Tax=Puccinia striiformis TaxID=27350 RepID=A0A0L0UW31_9BASI|nr:hypothetical protein Pst134EA_017230 [Puccinia striiformis f. sp. tritici]KAI9628495.1 hypothetical protein H4Q26_018023 [Puccinia striiformis f. sp. tritici PST-130]KNE91230.1 hypothetical protein PSTG_15330 [Puccinia striiformis f. sp. tritici PST-78]POW00544.1 hypothetical protein PSTT_13094 [Puccinia striiformis]KAH9450628.1 hypothetical protein Pst134EB_018158 [Puccinia striiformis f. sp. tritici]KAH9460918.1 hypothetical protein Pst134EA_017230 [Puccinia striiformis f. sp. tritici]